MGQVFTHPYGRTITEGDCTLYLGLTGDRFPLYCDGEFARRLGYSRELVNDLLVFHIVFGKTVPDISQNAVANLGYAEVLFQTPVYAGDTLNAVTEVVGKKENSSGKNGNVYVRTRGVNQRNETVLQFYRWVMVRKRYETSPAPKPHVPELPEKVAPENLPIDTGLTILKNAIGGARYFEDYKAGERIYHGGGMTIEEAEYATATRLYQNTARVHLDGHFMAEEDAPRLIYGGHVISVARALSFAGFENGLRILAWNGGTHANPMHAGDTLYAITDVKEKANIPGHDDVGALRLKLYGIKNLDPMDNEVEVKQHDPGKGRAVYHQNVVLELDYWVAMSRRG